METPENYKVRAGTKDSGKDYETKIAALMSLRCSVPEVEEMWLAMNVESCGDFDDLVIHRKDVGCTGETYIMQLKHQDNSKNIIRDQLLSDKGNYSLKKYESSLFDLQNKINCREGTTCAIINHLRQHNNVMPVLFTNNGINPYTFLKYRNNSNNIFLNTNKGAVLTIDYEELGFKLQDNSLQYFKDMCLFINQVGVLEINNLIEIAIKTLVKSLEIPQDLLNKLSQKYVTFVDQWKNGLLGGHYTLTKNLVLKKVAELLFEPYMSKFYETERLLNNKFRTKIWNEIIEEHDVTITEFDNSVIQFLLEYVIHTSTKSEKAQCEQEYRKRMLRCVSMSEKRTLPNDYEYLWKVRKMPLVLEADNEQSYQKIFSVLKNFNNLYKIIVMTNYTRRGPETEIQGIFATLSDLNNDSVQKILNAKIKLQGRAGVKLCELVKNKSEHLKLITASDVIRILSNSFNIGNSLASLPEVFIERHLPRILLQPKILETNNEIFVVTCRSFKKLISYVHNHRLQVEDSQIKEYNNNLGESRIIVITKDNLSVENLKEFSSKSVHQLILHDSQDLEWVKSVGSTKTVRSFRFTSEKLNLKPLLVNNVESFYSSRIKLVSAAPGMGKSVLLDYIALQASISTWILKINLKDHLNYYRSAKFGSLMATNHLQHFNDSVLRKHGCNTNLAQIVFQELCKSKNVLLLLDGFDEISVGFKQEVTKLVLALHKQGFSMWVTTRPVMREHTEEAFDSPAISLNLFNEENQTEYLTKHYTKLHSDFVTNPEKGELIKSFASMLLEVTKKNFSDSRFLRVPLHIKLLTHMFKQKCLNYVNTRNFTLNDNFDLIYLYEAFVKEKIQIFHEKYGKFLGDFCNQYEKYQQLLALKTLFSEDIFTGTKIEEQLRRFTDIITHQLLQRVGIVVPEDELDIAFSHHTYSEYLAAKWLSENFFITEHRKTSQILIRKLFESRYETVKNLFDRILAKNCDLHIAIINSNYEILDATKRNPLVNLTDKGGRSPLHLLATRGVHHPIPLPDNIKYVKKQTDLCIPEAMFDDVHDKDTIFGYTALDYATESGCLGIMDAICAKTEGVTLNIPGENLSSYLYYCALYGYTSLCEAILLRFQKTRNLKKAMDLNLTLHCATLKRRTEIVELLLTHGVDVNKKDCDGKTALHIAADNGFEDIVLILLSNGACIDKTDSAHFTPLHRAALKGHGDIVTLLLSSCDAHKATENLIYDHPYYKNYQPKQNHLDKTRYVNLVDKEKNTALHFSSINGHTSIVSLLLNSGADVNLTNGRGYTALHLACCKGYTSTVFVLLSTGKAIINIATKNITHPTALYLASLYGTTTQTYTDNTSGSPALHEATKGGYTKIVSLLLSRGANVNLTNTRGFSALHEAARGGHRKIVSLFLLHGADVNITNSRGSTALHEAARGGHTCIVALLMNAVSNINVEDNGGYTALHEAAWKGHSEVVLTLLSNKTENVNVKSKRCTTPLYLAAKHGHRNVVSLLLSKSAQVNIANNLGCSALHTAIQGGYKDIVSLLLSNGANINLADGQGRTPLFVACSFGHVNIVSLLLSKNAYTEKVNKHGVTVLHEAAYYGDVNMVSELLVYKSRVNVKDSVGKTALHHAVTGKNLLVIKELVKYGADVSVQDLDANCPLDLARKLNFVEIVKYLEKI